MTDSIIQRVAQQYLSASDGRGKLATSPQQWDEAAEILDKGEHHPAIKVVHDKYENVLKSIAEAAARSKRLKAVGVGRTEDPTFVLSMVVPAMEELAKTASAVAQQMQHKFRG
jgi:hypothetical protein